MGTPIFAGMLAASLVGIFVIPMLYVTFQYVSEWLDRMRGIDTEEKYRAARALKTQSQITPGHEKESGATA